MILLVRTLLGGNWRYIWYVKPHFSSMGTVLHNMGYGFSCLAFGFETSIG